MSDLEDIHREVLNIIISSSVRADMTKSPAEREALLARAETMREVARMVDHPMFPEPRRLHRPPTDPVQRAKYDALWAARA